MKFSALCISSSLILSFLFCSSSSFAADHEKEPKTVIEISESNPLDILKEGNRRFCTGQSNHPRQDLETMKELVAGQHPKAVVIGCSDSRVTPEIIFDQGLGDIFTIRTAGNVMGDYEEGSIEYAVEHLHTKLIIVMGHQSCGAVQALIDHHEHKKDGDHKDDEMTDHISAIIKKLEDEDEEQEALQAVDDKFGKAVVANVIHGVRQLQNSQPILSKEYKEGKVKIVGAIYHLDTGEVEFLDIE